MAHLCIFHTLMRLCCCYHSSGITYIKFSNVKPFPKYQILKSLLVAEQVPGWRTLKLYQFYAPHTRFFFHLRMVIFWLFIARSFAVAKHQQLQLFTVTSEVQVVLTSAISKVFVLFLPFLWSHNHVVLSWRGFAFGSHIQVSFTVILLSAFVDSGGTWTI